jgi:hypothetical protein
MASIKQYLDSNGLFNVQYSKVQEHKVRAKKNSTKFIRGIVSLI